MIIILEEIIQNGIVRISWNMLKIIKKHSSFMYIKNDVYQQKMVIVKKFLIFLIILLMTIFPNKSHCGEDIDRLITELRNNEKVNVRLEAAKTLGELKNPKAIEPLIETIKEPFEDINVRKAAIWAIGELKASQGIDTLIEIFSKDEERYVLGEELRQALKKIGSPVVQPLISLLEKSNSLTEQSDILNILSEVGDIRVTKIFYSFILKYAYQSQKCAESNRSGIITFSPESDTNWDAQNMVDNSIKGLLGSEKSNPEYIISLLKSEYWYIRWRMLYWLTQIKSPLIKNRNVFDTLVSILQDEESMNRSLSSELLGDIGDKSAVETLTYVAKNDNSDDVRNEANEAIKKIKSNYIKQKPKNKKPVETGE